MESTVSNQIIEVLDALCEKFGIAIDWTSQNVMPYVQELMKKAVNYELWTSIVSFILFVGGIYLYIKFVKWCYKVIKEDEYAYDFATLFVAAVIVGGLISVCFIFGIFCEVSNIITCLTFPEKIIFNMIQSMM